MSPPRRRRPVCPACGGEVGHVRMIHGCPALKLNQGTVVACCNPTTGYRQIGTADGDAAALAAELRAIPFERTNCRGISAGMYYGPRHQAPLTFPKAKGV